MEGHADTRMRWTANLTTFSNKDRILRGEFPYAEFMFRAEGEILQQRLKQHLRSRGYPAWASASTSEKGSYREEDVLEFLDTSAGNAAVAAGAAGNAAVAAMACSHGR